MYSQGLIQRPNYFELDSKIFYLDNYHPYRNGNNPKFSDFSRFILDLKEKRPTNFHQQKKDLAIQYFFRKLNLLIEKSYPIVTIPSSDPLNINTGLNEVVVLLAEKGCINATSCLKRHTTVEKKASGGKRDITIELNSIKVNEQHLIKEKTVILLDDIKTTGNSFSACEKLLLDAGAFKVVKLALGKTVQY